MIPQGRPAVTEADLAAVRGRDIKTWRTRDAEAFRARVPVLNPGERLRLYDRAQAEAYYAGRPLPALPSEPHPDDLLSDQEAADVLGISRHTVRAYASTGYLPPGQELYGRRWWTRRDVDARHAAGDRRSTPVRPPSATSPPNSPTPTPTSPARPTSPHATGSAPAPRVADSPPHANSATTTPTPRPSPEADE